MSEGTRRLAAIMFTDIVGYTALTQSDESLAMKLLEKHRELIRPVFPKHSGREVKTIGDAFLVEFASALEATECAVEMQKILHEFNETATYKILVRVGIHVGDVIHRDDDVYGDAVNIASRIEPMAPAGGVCISEQVYAQVRNKIPYPLTKLQTRELKNVAYPIEAYKLVLPWDDEHLGSRIADNSRVAVLPFVNISPDPNDEYFADGLTEELISTISNMSQLSVISRTSVMSYKGAKKKLTEIGSELDVGSVLEGSVRKAGNRMRITCQLINVGTDKHIWAQSYDRELDDVFAIQSDIAKQVADALRIQILPKEERQIEKKPTSSTEAYTLYLKGRYYWNERTKQGLLNAIEYFKHAIALDPSYALAYAGIADCYSVLGDHGYVPYREAFTMSKENALKAVQYDDLSAEAHTSLASALGQNDYDWDGAETEFERALELNPNYATGHHWYSILLQQRGNLEGALREALRAQELDPLSLQIMVFVGSVYDAMRKYDLAEEQMMKVLEVDPNFVSAHGNLYSVHFHQGKYEEAERDLEEYGRLTSNPPVTKAWLAALYAFAGKKDEARKILIELGDVPTEVYIPTWPIIVTYIGLGEKERAIEMIEKAYDERADWLPSLVIDPLFDSVKSEPRVVGVLKKIGLGG